MWQALQARPLYPWMVCCLCMLLVATSNGMINSGITVFDEAILDEFGWTLTQLKTRDSITFMGASILVLVAGWAVDRFGFKPLLILGMGTLTLAYALYGKASSLTHVYLLHGLFALVAASAGNMTNIVAAATWNPQHRGMAVGMTIAGTSVGGMLLPPLANWLNQQFGWRQSLQIEALIPLVMLIAVVTLIGNRRAASPESSEANTASNAAKNTAKNTAGLRFTEVLHLPQFYLIALAGAFTYFAVLALFSHLFLYMRSLEFSPAQASVALSMLSLAALSGKLLSGWLADKLNPFRFFKIEMCLMLAGIIGISQAPSLIWVFLLLTGLGWGGLHTLYNFILIHLFGLRDAGKINGAVSVFEAAGGAAGIFFTGVVHDSFGGYGASWLMVMFVMGLGTLLIMPLKPLREIP